MVLWRVKGRKEMVFKKIAAEYLRQKSNFHATDKETDSIRSLM